MSLKLTENPDGSLLFTSTAPVVLENGDSLAQWQLCFEAWGTLNEQKNNVVLIHHALSVGSHVASSAINSQKGWWQEMVGPGKAVDTNRFYVICINNLGSCFGSSGPMTINSQTGLPWTSDFPVISMADMAMTQKRLLDYLGIEPLYAIIGNSMGAMVSLSWAIDYPQSVERLMLNCSSHKAYPANIANRHIQQEAIRMDPAFKGGHYHNDDHLGGFCLARKLGLYTYRNATEWNRRFNSFGNEDMSDDEINRYMDYNANQFCQSFDANTYLTLTTAMDKFDVTRQYGSVIDTFARISAKTTVLSVASDILFTPQQQQELYSCLQQGEVDCHYIDHESQYGHDAFLVEIERFSQYIREFLA
jgi:homoserine O-acetyltransferase